MSTPWPEPNDGERSQQDAEEIEELDESELMAAVNDPYARVHEALDRSLSNGDMPEGWHLTDFVVVAAAESARTERREQTLMLYVGPRDELPPHRIMGLLDYARQRYNHNITCCRCGGLEIDVDDDDDAPYGSDPDDPSDGGNSA